MKRTSRRMGLCIAMILAILVFIWGNSLMPAQVSLTFSNWVADLLHIEPSAETTVLTGRGILRKVAHFLEFAALGFSLGCLFGMLRKGVLLPFLCGAAAACIDETIQLFVPNRGPGLADVLLDSCGVAAGIALLYFGYTCIQKRSTKQ